MIKDRIRLIRTESEVWKRMLEMRAGARAMNRPPLSKSEGEKLMRERVTVKTFNDVGREGPRREVGMEIGMVGKVGEVGKEI